MSRLATNNPTHRGGARHRSRPPTEHGLPQQTDQRMAAVLASACIGEHLRGDRKGYDAGKLGDLAAACAGEQEKADDVAERAAAVGGVPDGDDFVVGECARLAGLAATSSTTPNGTSGSFEAASRCPIVHLLRISLPKV